ARWVRGGMAWAPSREISRVGARQRRRSGRDLSMKALLLRLWRSRILTVLLVAVVAFSVVFAARTVLPAIRLGGPRLAPLIQPKLDGVEPGVLAHIRQ